MAPLVLYHFAPSAPSRIALLAVRNLELDAEIREVDLFNKEQFSEGFLKLNPQHTIPTIDDNGFVLWESRAIAVYLTEKKYPGGHGLYPKCPKKRALINQRLQFDCGTLYPRIRAVGYPALFLGETKISDDKREKIYEAMEWVDSFLEGQKYIAGEELTLADLSILASIASFIHISGNISKWKNLSEWYERCRSIPGFDENEQGAKAWGDRILSVLVDRF